LDDVGRSASHTLRKTYAEALVNFLCIFLGKKGEWEDWLPTLNTPALCSSPAMESLRLSTISRLYVRA